MTKSDEVFVNAFEQQEQEAYRISEDHGFHEEPNNFGERISLMHAELSEALEYRRTGDGPSNHIPKFKGVEEEFADVIIRIMDAAQEFGYNVGPAIIAKMEFNASRPYKHGGKKF